MLSSLACHGAIKANHEMGREEISRLLADLDRTRVPTHCPHAAP
jgi:DNA mismatch repair ATPase MutL